MGANSYVNLSEKDFSIVIDGISYIFEEVESVDIENRISNELVVSQSSGIGLPNIKNNASIVNITWRRCEGETYSAIKRAFVTSTRLILTLAPSKESKDLGGFRASNAIISALSPLRRYINDGTTFDIRASFHVPYESLIELDSSGNEI